MRKYVLMISGMALLLAMSPVAHAQIGDPSDLTVTSKSASAIELSWTAATGSPSGYNVLRCVQGTGANCTPAYLAWSTNTTYSDSSVTANTTYRYAVQACSPCGNWSNEVVETAEAATAPGAPGGLTVQASASKVALSWTAPADTGNSALSGYTLYRGSGNSCSSLTALTLTIAAGATWVEDTTVSANSTYCYQLSARNALGGEGAKSGSAVATAVNPGAPRNLKVTSKSASAIGLSWAAPLNDGGGAMAGYDVYRCVQGTGSNCTPAYHAWSTSTSYSDGSVAANTRYRYAVDAVRADAASDWSNEVTETAEAATAPGAPGGLIVRASASKVTLSWTAPSDTGNSALSGYTLYRGDGDGCNNLSPDTMLGAGATSAEDTSVFANITYCYQVSAFNTLGGEGSRSGSAVVTVVNPAAPSSLLVSTFSTSAIALSWTAPDDAGGAPDGYNVYRCVQESEDDCTPAYLAWAISDSYIDKSVTENTRYRYAVAAVRADSTSDLSNQVTASAIDNTPPANTAPVFASDALIGDLVFTVGAAIDPLTLPRATGGEIDAGLNAGELSDYSFDPAALPEGLEFDRFTRELSGTPAAALAQSVYTYWVHDDDEDYATTDADSLSFTITIEEEAPPANTAPVFASDALIGDLVFTVGAAIDPLTLPRATGGEIDAGLNAGELSDYSFDPAALPEGLEFDRFTRELSGTPAAALAQSVYTYWVHDDDDDYATTDADNLSFTITIEEEAPPANTAPVFASDALIGDLMFTVGAAIDPLTLPRATGGEIDAGLNAGELSDYSFDPAALPEGLEFDRFTRELSGTPAAALAQSVYTYWVHDDDDDYATTDADNLSFTITIEEEAPPLPVVTPGEITALENISASIGRSMLSSIIPMINRRFSDAPNASSSGLAPGSLAQQAQGRRTPPAAYPRQDETKPTLGHVLGNAEFARPLTSNSGAGPDWILWGAGNLQSFDDDVRRYDGDYKAAYLGLDAHIGESWIAGVTVSRGIGQAGYDNGNSIGDFELTMTTVLPYARLRFNERHAVWMILGAGWGDAEHTNQTGIRHSGDASMRLGAFGARTELGAGPGGVDWAVHGDLAYLKLDSLYDLSVGVSRVRLGLESSSTFPVHRNAHIRPFIELNTRFDKGAGANNGTGIEFVAGARYADASCGFWLEARGRVLALHSAQDYQERGFSVSLGREPCYGGTGLSLLLAPQWGQPSGSAQTLWEQNNIGWPGSRLENGRRGGSLRAEIGYSFRDPRFGGILTPFTGVDIGGETRRAARLGAQYRHTGRSHELQIELSYGLAMQAGLSDSAHGGEVHPEALLSGALRLLPPLRGLGLAGHAHMLTVQPQEVSGNAEDSEDEELSFEEIVVTAKFQRSLREALNRKRQATEIIEALSAEEIGQLPDTSVAESLARLPGLAHTRNAFGANNLSIRGLGAVLTNGTLNGRDLASEWGDRSVSFNLFPAELISRASIYKAPSAAHVEGGIGGTIDLQTARALEWGEQVAVLNLRARHNGLGGKLPEADSVGYRGSATYIDQLLDGTLGFAVGYAGQQAPLVSANSYIYESRTVEYGGFITGLPDGFGENNSLNIPYGAENNVLSGDGARHSLLAAIQWRPSDRFEFNLDGFYTDYEQKGGSHGLVLGGLGSFGNAYDHVTADGVNLTGATVTCSREPAIDCLERGFGQDLSALNAADNAASDLQSYGAGVIWTADPLTLTYDFSWSRASGESEYTTVQHRPYSLRQGEFALIRPTAAFGENEDGAAFLVSPLNFSDPATNWIDGLGILEGEREDEIFTYRFDAEYAMNTPFLTAVRGGLRIVNRDNTLVSRQKRVAPAEMDMPVAIDSSFVLTSFDQSRIDSAFQANPILVLDVQVVRDAVFPNVSAQVQPSGSHFIEEDVLATYLQADFAVDALFGVPAAGNFGVRVVTTDVDTAGTSSLEGVAERITTSDKYTEILPSANLNLFFADDLVVRLAASRVMARPAVNFLTPGTDQYSNQIFGGPNGGGNPYLRPFVADQLDLSVERYFGEGSAIAVALFYKEMDTFITQDRIESGPPEDTVSFIPANGGGGRVLGIETTFQHNFTNLLPEGYGQFGIYATYTYTDSNIRLTETFNSSTFGLDGQSDHLGNVTLHYYRGRFAARFSYRYRSDFTRPQRPARAFTTNKAEGDLSFHFGYGVNERLQLALEGWNLLDEPRDNYYGLKSLQGAYSIFGRSIQLGVTYRP